MTASAATTPKFSRPEGAIDGPTRHEPFRSYDWEASSSDPKRGRVSLWMRPHHPSKSPTPWFADLAVSCRDLARLMREGFFWSPDSIVPEEGYTLPDTVPHMASKGFKAARVWRLIDRQQRAGEATPLWIGWLTVDFRDLALLSTFRIQDLSVDMISMASARNAKGKVVYDFSRYVPERCVNYIYDDMPLRGWWPYPRLDDDQTAPGKNEEDGELGVGE